MKALHLAPQIGALAALLIGAPLSAQRALDPSTLADSIRHEVDRASIEGDEARLEAAQVLAERAVAAFPESGLLMHYLGSAMYRQATLAQGDEARELAERAEGIFRRAADLEPMPETLALLGTVLGLQIGANPLKGMLLGPKSTAAIERAMDLDGDNPRVWMLHGTAAIHTPGMFGGGLERAIERLERALELFESDDPASAMPAWGHAECFAWLGIAKMRDSDLDGAELAFETALSMEPKFSWVSGVLLPQLAEMR